MPDIPQGGMPGFLHFKGGSLSSRSLKSDMSRKRISAEWIHRLKAGANHDKIQVIYFEVRNAPECGNDQTNQNGERTV